MIYIENNKVKILGYQKICQVNDKNIIFIDNKKNILVEGNDLIIDYLENDEFSIIGMIKKIEFYD